jgi:CubicO group peptidase (beta-lactamase class C family)
MDRARREAIKGAVSGALLAAFPRRSSAKDGAAAAFIVQAKQDVEAAMKAHAIPGAAACLIVDGEPAWMEAFGETGGSASRPVDTDTIFSVQSTSKNFCATATMLAVQRGLADLDKPITDYLPAFTVNSRHEAEPQRLMTLRRLLSHHAGFTHEAPVGNNFVYDFEGPPPDFQAHIESIQTTWLRYPVGERHSYSNLGIDVAGYVLERVTGLPYPEVLRRWIFEPLGMHRSTAASDVYVADRNRAVGHAAPYDRVPVRIPIVPSGGVYTCVADMAKYAQFHLRRGAGPRGAILAPALWEEMHDYRYGGNYALGVARHQLRLARGTVAVHGHDGGGFGFGCCFMHVPAEGVAWIVHFNDGVGNVFDDIAPDPLMQVRYGAPLPDEPNPNPPVVLELEALQDLTGLYVVGDERCHVTVKDGTLQLAFDNGWGENKLTFLSPTEAWVSEGAKRSTAVRFHRAQGLVAPRFELPLGVSWDFIDGPSVPAGPVGAKYDDRLGRYQYEIWGKRVGKPELSRRNGWLYFDDLRLAPFAPGLLFSGAGEALDLRGPDPTARNIILHRA